MALMSTRLLGRNIRSHLAATNRFYADKYLLNASDHSTGAEKFEMLQRMKGNDDPFKFKGIKRQASTKANPVKVPSYYDCRIIGCVCEEDSASIVWMWLYKGEARRCQCGHWFKLTEYKPE